MMSEASQPSGKRKSWLSRSRAKLSARWSSRLTPESEATFEPKLMLKEAVRLVTLPAIGAAIGASCIWLHVRGKLPQEQTPPPKIDESAEVSALEDGSDTSKSHIVVFDPSANSLSFRGGGGGSSAEGRGGARMMSAPRRSPGTLVRARVLNLVETFQTAPVYAQITDYALGEDLFGATVIGDASPNSAYERILMQFQFVKDARDPSLATPLTADGLSLDGRLGVVANKKGSLGMRTGITASQGALHGTAGSMSSNGNLQSILLRALVQGLDTELGNDLDVARNRNTVLTLEPGTEFYIRLQAPFPDGGHHE